jgi:hypothetical protein
MTIEEAHAEVNYGWAQSYSPKALAQAVAAVDDRHLGDRFNILIARLCFRGIYFPMMTKSSWLRVLLENRRTILTLVKAGVFRWMRPRLFRSRRRSIENEVLVGTPETALDATQIPRPAEP